MSEQETENLICQACGQDHSKNMLKWCDRSTLEIKYKAAQDKIQLLEKQNEIYRKALEFYAEKDNWWRDKNGWRHDMIDSDLDDETLNDWEGRFSGRRARQALKDAEVVK